MVEFFVGLLDDRIGLDDLEIECPGRYRGEEKGEEGPGDFHSSSHT